MAACFICGGIENPVKVKWFMMLWYVVHEPICQTCWGIKTSEPKYGTWEDDTEVTSEVATQNLLAQLKRRLKGD